MSFSVFRRLPSSLRHANRGVTLIEILVTVVIVSVGLLGVAALQAVSYRDNYSAYLRGQASALADDILDRMRANRIDATAYAVDIGDSLATTTQAGRDVTEWKAQLASLLPKSTSSGVTADADGSITVTEITARRYFVVVEVQWGERGTSNPMSFVTRTEI